MQNGLVFRVSVVTNRNKSNLFRVTPLGYLNTAVRFDGSWSCITRTLHTIVLQVVFGYSLVFQALVAMVKRQMTNVKSRICRGFWFAVCVVFHKHTHANVCRQYRL